MLGERLQIEIEDDNSNDAKAVAVQKRSIVVGHLPRETARIVWYFLKRGGSGWCEIVAFDSMLVGSVENSEKDSCLMLTLYNCK